MSLISCNDVTKLQGDWNEVTIGETKSPLNVEIFSEQLKWIIRNTWEDNELGKFDYKLTSKKNPLGLMTTKSIDFQLNDFENESQSMDSMMLTDEVKAEFVNQLEKNEK